MKTCIILESDNLALNVSDLINPKELTLIGIGNSKPDTWNVFEDENQSVIKDQIDGMPIMPTDLAIAMNPDVLVIGAITDENDHALKYLAMRAGYMGDIISINDMYKQISVKTSVIRNIARRINKLGLDGDIAELGCYNGDTSWQLNVLFPNKKLYLFDTFQGNDERDLQKEAELELTGYENSYPIKNQEEKLLSRLSYPENAILKKGWFPETAFDLEDQTYAFVYLDAGLYLPTLTGLEYFFPRLVQGGVIFVAGYENSKYSGIYQAVNDFESKYGAFLILPVGDLTGSIMIIRP